MPRKPARANREKHTVEVMIELYCRGVHGSKPNLCGACQGLMDYAFEKIDACPQLMDKPTCLNCKVHCYDETRREDIRKIMRYSGPRMLARHPVLTIFHVIDGRKGRD